MKQSIILFILLLMSSLKMAQAKSADYFFKRFQLQRDSKGKLIAVKDRTLPINFSIDPYIKQLKKEILDEQSLIKNEGHNQYEADIRSLFDSLSDLTGSKREYDQYLDQLIKSMEQLSDLNVNAIFSDKSFNDIISQFQNKINNDLKLIDPTLIAKVNDPTYFYKRNITHKSVDWALEITAMIASSVPVVNTASYIIVQTEKMILARRDFHQNILLHYLENFKESELGLTKNEVNLIRSSIYESRIPWHAPWNSQIAKRNWDQFGQKNFSEKKTLASTHLKEARHLYSELIARNNFAFETVVLDNKKVIINLLDKEDIFHEGPALAYSYSDPNKVERRRVILKLTGLGLNSLPLFAIVGMGIDYFIKSAYEKQILTEGALYGYFESTADNVGKKQLIIQNLNPFDSLIYLP